MNIPYHRFEMPCAVDTATIIVPVNATGEELDKLRKFIDYLSAIRKEDK